MSRPKHAKQTDFRARALASIAEEYPNINHVKATDPDLGNVTGLREPCDAVLLAGSVEVKHHLVLWGCEGASTAAPQIFSRAFRAWSDGAGGRVREAGRNHYDRLLPFAVGPLLELEEDPAVVKHAQFRLGVIPSDELLPPLTPLDFLPRAEIAAVLNDNAFDKKA